MTFHVGGAAPRFGSKVFATAARAGRLTSASPPRARTSSPTAGVAPTPTSPRRIVPSVARTSSASTGRAARSAVERALDEPRERGRDRAGGRAAGNGRRCASGERAAARPRGTEAARRPKGARRPPAPRTLPDPRAHERVARRQRRDGRAVVEHLHLAVDRQEDRAQGQPCGQRRALAVAHRTSDADSWRAAATSMATKTATCRRGRAVAGTRSSPSASVSEVDALDQLAHEEQPLVDEPDVVDLDEVAVNAAHDAALLRCGAPRRSRAAWQSPR